MIRAVFLFGKKDKKNHNKSGPCIIKPTVVLDNVKQREAQAPG